MPIPTTPFGPVEDVGEAMKRLIATCVLVSMVVVLQGCSRSRPRIDDIEDVRIQPTIDTGSVTVQLTTKDGTRRTLWLYECFVMQEQAGWTGDRPTTLPIVPVLEVGHVRTITPY